MKKREKDSLAVLFSEVEAEVIRARAKFPGNDVTGYALVEEVGELFRAILHLTKEAQGSPEHVRRELIQSMAMLCRLWIDGDSSVGLKPIGKLGEKRPRRVNCMACKHAYMEPDGDLICGVGGGFGLKIYTPGEHCSGGGSFAQHPLRTRAGRLKRVK